VTIVIQEDIWICVYAATLALRHKQLGAQREVVFNTVEVNESDMSESYAILPSEEKLELRESDEKLRIKRESM